MNNNEEVWKSVVGFEDLFEISSFGRLKSIRHKDEKILTQTILKTGYYTVATKIGGRSGKNYCFRIHRLVAEAFLDTPTDKNILKELNSHYGKIPVNHKDGNKLNNHYTNLEWCTYSQNSKHAIKNNLLIIPEESTLRKLKKEDVLFIRNNYNSENSFSMRELARIYNVNKNCIEKIVRNKTYKNII